MGDAGAGDNDDTVRLQRIRETGDSVARGGYEFGEFGGALQSGFCAGGSENSGGAGLDDGFEGAGEAGSFVEGAVKRYGQRPREVHESSRAGHVNAAIFFQDPQNDPIHPGFVGYGDGALHFRELGVRVDEVSGAGADHGIDGDVDFFADGAEQFAGRRESADGEVGAEFEAVGATARGSEGFFDGVDADFEEVFSRHRLET